jgi:hypothetical protein
VDFSHKADTNERNEKPTDEVHQLNADGAAAEIAATAEDTGK